MKKCVALLVTIFFILSACSNPSTSNAPEQNGLAAASQDSSPFIEAITGDNEGLDPEENPPSLSEHTSLTNQIEDLNLDPDQVRVVSTSQFEWSDSCLGIDQPGVECLPQATKVTGS